MDDNKWFSDRRKNKYPENARDFVPDSKRGKRRIFSIYTSFQNVEAGTKGKQD